MRLLTFTTLYPNAARPNHGIFVETRLRKLVGSGQVVANVVAPVPWFPSSSTRFGRYAAFAQVARQEIRHGIQVLHPRYPLLPKIGMTLAPLLLALAVKPLIERMIREGNDFDLIDAHYYYPDGVAAVLLGRIIGKPVVITARGSDVNLLSGFALPRKMILWAAERAAATITVSAALKTVLTGLGADADKIHVFRNGVDTQLFHPIDRILERARLGLKGRVFLSVGNLVNNKGHDLVIRALREFPEACLLVIGEGEEARNLNSLARSLAIQDRVRFLGAMPQKELARYFGMADALVLASSREGWPNVLLEAMACGTPVVAANVGGTPEIVTAPQAGVLMNERSVTGVVEASRRLFENYPNREHTRRYAEGFSWDDTTSRQLALFERLLHVHSSA